jgi:phosphoribosylformylglycinamidine synthase
MVKVWFYKNDHYWEFSMGAPICLLGVDAFSDFRLKALCERVAAVMPSVKTIAATYVYFLEVSEPPSASDMEKATALLGACDGEIAQGGFMVTPRKGTISPWSSKATDIFHNSGLVTFLRVERGIQYRLQTGDGTILSLADAGVALEWLHDRMTEGVYEDVSDLFAHSEPAPFKTVDVLGGGEAALQEANRTMGLALSDEEVAYLLDAYQRIQRNPTDVELVMFGQVNSEHCRHKIFNADWVIDGQPQPQSLFDMIRNTHKLNPGNTLVAYKDNSGVLKGFEDVWFEVCRDGSQTYAFREAQMDMVIKVETHNHPTAIAPFPGAATGVGGEIRDECATGIGGKSKAGLSAFMVSNLRVPGYRMPWERDVTDFPSRLATPLDIMIEAPIGGANFGNEFGRPQLCGLFKTYEDVQDGRYRGYHKPIMAAGGMGNIKRIHVEKKDIPEGSYILQLGGPAMRIGLGGGAASSMDTGSNAAELDFDSVQRGNAEMERRCQEVVDACIALEAENPILSIHDIGAGGLSNGCPELVAETGGVFQLRKIHNEERSMSPMEIWCCEAQERYVLAVAPESLDGFLSLCERERCPVAVLGQATGDQHLTLEDSHFDNKPIDIDLGVILGKPPKMLRDVKRMPVANSDLDIPGLDIAEAVSRVLQLPAVANKSFLITIADRSITGMVARDQMVGPWQTPIADAAVTATSLRSTHGEVMAMGERTNVALISPPASGRLAIGEALTNLAGTAVGSIETIKLSANWMCACGEEGEDAGLYDTVKAVGLELCPALGIAIPVGKDSLSMRTVWQDQSGNDQKMTAPLSLIISAFATVNDVRKTVTPDLKPGASRLLMIDLGEGRNRLGGSAFAQVYNQVGSDVPDVNDPTLLKKFFAAIQTLVAGKLLLAYHDRSDGGVLVTVAEMAFGGRRGADICFAGDPEQAASVIFNEELGAVLQVADGDVEAVLKVLDEHGLASVVQELGPVCDSQRLTVQVGGVDVYASNLSDMNRLWSSLTTRMQALRDNPACAQEEFDNLLDEDDLGMQFSLTYDPEAPHVVTSRPRMAILREQGINGQVEMAAAFDRAGFECADVHMTDLLAGRFDLATCSGLVACGGFSYGDVLGAGSGWAKSILFNDRLREMFATFFARPETFTLGVCNGCQMVSQLKEIIPGASHWPSFTRNRSEQFEARYVTVEVLESPSVLLNDMAGSRIGIAVAHGEGFADFSETGNAEAVAKAGLASLRYVDGRGNATERYPYNPNGSAGGLTGLTTEDGRVTIMMPHPERGFRSLQLSYRPEGYCDGEAGPWLRLFQNARTFVN